MTEKRIQRSQEAIETAFIELLRENSFNSISVSAIIRNAGVNRSTFYAHYLDKYDLLEKLENKLLDRLNLLSQNPEKMTQESLRERAVKLLSMLYTHREFFAIAMDQELRASFVEKVCRLIDMAWEKYHSNHTFAVPLEYVKKACASIVASAVTGWVQDGFRESVDELADIITIMLSDFYKSMLISPEDAEFETSIEEKEDES